MGDIKIEIPEALCDYIESLKFECDARADLVAYMIRLNIAETPRFQKYHTEYVEFRTKYEIAKRELADTFVKPVMVTDKYRWELDFTKREVTIYGSC